MTYTDEFKLIREYLDNRTIILQQFSGQEESQRCREGLNLLQKEYAKLLKKQQVSSQDPSKKLKVLQKRLEDMFQLLSLWTQYVEVIYMPESELHVLSAVEKMDARPEDTAYGFRAEEKDVRTRLNTLFG